MFIFSCTSTSTTRRANNLDRNKKRADAPRNQQWGITGLGRVWWGTGGGKHSGVSGFNGYVGGDGDGYGGGWGWGGWGGRYFGGASKYVSKEGGRSDGVCLDSARARFF